MTNRQRRRAQNIIRCYKNTEMIYLIKEELVKIEHIEENLSSVTAPQFINYDNTGSISIIDSLTNQQTLKIEFEFLIEQMRYGRLDFNDYLSKLDILVNQVNVNALTSQKVENNSIKFKTS